MTRAAVRHGDETPAMHGNASITARSDHWFLICERAIADQRAGKPPQLASVSSVQWHRVAYRRAYEAAARGVDITKTARRMVSRPSKRSDYSADAERDIAHYAAGERFVEGGQNGTGRWEVDPSLTPDLIESAREMLALVRRERRIAGKARA